MLSEDHLGLDKIYIQAKRWENTVGRPEIQQFKGALADQVAKKGVFITTSNFSKEAMESNDLGKIKSFLHQNDLDQFYRYENYAPLEHLNQIQS